MLLNVTALGKRVYIKHSDPTSFNEIKTGDEDLLNVWTSFSFPLSSGQRIEICCSSAIILKS